jgi:hypothetical protein
LGNQQIHDFNPGITQTGLFWTSIVRHSNVRVDLNNGRATLEVSNLHMQDFFDLENAVIGGKGQPVPVVVSYRVEWTATGAATAFDNPDQQYRGQLSTAAAQMEWSARTPQFEFVSAPIETSTTDAALLGQESNGAFY